MTTYVPFDRSQPFLVPPDLKDWIAEIDESAVADVLADKAVEPGHHVGDGAVKGDGDLAQILGVEPRRERHRAQEIAAHHRELPPLGRCQWTTAAARLSARG